MVKQIKYTRRDENATELNGLLEKMLGNLQDFSDGIDEALMDLTTDDINRTSRDPFDLLNNLEDTCRYFELTTQQKVITPIIEDLRGIVYCGSEFVPLLERKECSEYVKKEDTPLWLAENVKPLIQQGIRSQKECGLALNRDPSGLSKMVRRVYNLKWDVYVNKIDEGVL